MNDFLETILILLLFFIIEWFAIWVGLYGLNDLFPNFISNTFVHVIDIWLILSAIEICINAPKRDKHDNNG